MPEIEKAERKGRLVARKTRKRRALVLEENVERRQRKREILLHVKTKESDVEEEKNNK